MLTDDITDHLMHFYGKAIWDTVETNYPTMKQGTWATYFHLTSADEAPAHHFCSTEEKLWCFYNNAKALKQRPENHSLNNMYLTALLYKKLQYIMDIYSVSKQTSSWLGQILFTKSKEK